MKREADSGWVTCPPKSISDFRKVDESEWYSVFPYGDLSDTGDIYMYLDGYGNVYSVFELLDEEDGTGGEWGYSFYYYDGTGLDEGIYYPDYGGLEPLASKESACDLMIANVYTYYPDNITDKRLASRKKAAEDKAGFVQAINDALIAYGNGRYGYLASEPLVFDPLDDTVMQGENIVGVWGDSLPAMMMDMAKLFL